MAHRDLPGGQRTAHTLGQIEQADQIGDMAARFVDQRAQRFLRVVKLVDQPTIGQPLLNCVEVGALNIFKQRHFERHRIIKFLNDYRNMVKLYPLCRAPATLARDNAIAAATGRPHDDGLENAMLADRRGELVQRIFVEMIARLIGVRENIGNRNFARSVIGGALRRPRIAKQRRQPTP